MSRKWSKEDIATLKAMADTHTKEEIAAALGRSYDAIRKRLHLQKAEEYP